MLLPESKGANQAAVYETVTAGKGRRESLPDATTSSVPLTVYCPEDAFLSTQGATPKTQRAPSELVNVVMSGNPTPTTKVAFCPAGTTVGGFATTHRAFSRQSGTAITEPPGPVTDGRTGETQPAATVSGPGTVTRTCQPDDVASTSVFHPRESRAVRSRVVEVRPVRACGWLPVQAASAAAPTTERHRIRIRIMPSMTFRGGRRFPISWRVLR